MQFTDAVMVSGNPPVTPDHLRTCKQLLKDFAEENSIALPVAAEWSEHNGNIHFVVPNDGKPFGIGAPKAN
ncbi:hypothetical protein [Agrobacterium rubi]|uniref:hypothetical protein n=1 Tax=Agrobacterium rubi TaxID=28099 RepID=UPI001573F273|nr:hypothetical protein [Agrobacterium rubi]NTE87207.1 hypothetical protein [Agrobacterium rubi]NTF03141.1 hypothetical protein [Agrobacterium rubi]